MRADKSGAAGDKIAILERRTDGAVVRLAIPTQPEKIEESKARLAAFAGELYPELRRILPQ